MKYLLIAIILIIQSLAWGDTSNCQAYYIRIFDENKHFGLQAFKFNLDRLSIRFSELKSKSDDEKLSAIMSSNTRILFFNLQSLSRIYFKQYKDPFFGEKLKFFKSYEDLVGKVDLWNSMWVLAEKIEEPKLSQYFLRLKENAALSLLTKMKSSGFFKTPEAVFDSLYKELEQFEDWKGPKKDLQSHSKQIAKELRELAEEVKARKYTKDDIEEGLHELRRQMRWLLIHIQVFNHATQYDVSTPIPSDVKAYFKQLEAENPKIMSSVFLKMDPAEIEHPLLVPSIPHATLTEIVTYIGKEKDKAEDDIYFEKAMTELNFSQAEASQVQDKLLKVTNRTEKTDHKALSEKIQSDLEKSGIFEFYADTLDSLND